SAVFAERRPSWSHRQATYPGGKAYEETLPFAHVAARWVKQYDFRFVEGEPKRGGSAVPVETFSKLWIGDRAPRKIDALALMVVSDAFFARIFHAKRELVPFGTVSLTTYFHADDAALEAENTTRAPGLAGRKIFH